MVGLVELLLQVLLRSVTRCVPWGGRLGTRGCSLGHLGLQLPLEVLTSSEPQQLLHELPCREQQLTEPQLVHARRPDGDSGCSGCSARLTSSLLARLSCGGAAAAAAAAAVGTAGHRCGLTCMFRLVRLISGQGEGQWSG